MTPEEKARLSITSQAVAVAVGVIRRELVPIEEFLVIDDTRDSDWAAALAVMKPILKAAKSLVDVHDLQIRRARVALTAVNTK